MRLSGGVASDLAGSNGASKLLHTLARKRRCYIHRIVAERIVPLEEDSLTVMHMEVDGRKADTPPINKVGRFLKQLGLQR